MYQGKTSLLNDFSGGLASNLATTTQTNNQASDLDNIIVLSFGRGFRKRNGNTAFNASAMNSGAAVQGLGYLKVGATENLVAVAGNKIYKSAMTGSMTDITGSVTVTAGQNNRWTFVPFNGKVLGFGGVASSPDAPFVWTGSGNAAALGGSPPSAYGAFQVNNRIFAYNTAANPSTIYWSALANEADWTSTGSGSSDVSIGDNDSIQAHAIINTNTVLLFKQNSVWQMITTSAPFPVFPLFSEVGCVGKDAVVVVRGVVYFITSQGRMRVTDGSRILLEHDLPNLGLINDKWSALNTSRYPYISGIHYEGADFEHIVWFVSSGGSSSNDKAFIWDVRNNCWLQNTTGHSMNCATRTQAGALYAGGYDGKIYHQDAGSTTVTDASNSGAAVVGYWTSGWSTKDNFEDIKQIRQLTVAFRTQDGGNFEIAYGYDFNAFQNSFTVSQLGPGAVWDVGLWDIGAWGSQTDLLKPGQRFTGRGNVFQYRIRSQTAFNTTINSLMFSGKEYGQKLITGS